MDLLERYLKQIERYLPFKDRNETTKELRSLILDQVDVLLRKGISEDDAIYQIIKEMGEPREVASKYNESRPMFSREMEPIMMLVFKIVSITLPLTVLFGQSMEYIFSTNEFNVMNFFIDIVTNIPSALYSLLVGYGFIFIIFFLIEKFIQPKFEVETKEFNPNLLPKIPAKAFKVSVFESVFVILLICFAVYIFNLRPGLIAVYYDQGRIPLLNENFNRVLMFMNIGWFVSIGLHVYYLFKRKKNIKSKTVEFIHDIYSGAVLILFAVSNVINNVVIEEYDLTFIPNMIKITFMFIGIAVIIGGVVQFVKMFINLDALDEYEKK